MDKGGHALACLRDNKDKLSDACKAEVFERQAVAADDWRTDPELFAACQVCSLSLSRIVGERSTINAAWHPLDALPRYPRCHATAAESSDPPCAMQTDSASNCKNVSAHGGATQECLRTHRPLLTWNCQEQLFRQEVENADDLRLSTRLFKACLEDKKKVTSLLLHLCAWQDC